jgi:Cu-Zn family superoxide dismutase
MPKLPTIFYACVIGGATAVSTTVGADEPVPPNKPQYRVVVNAVTPVNVGPARGTIAIEQKPYGVVFTPSLTGLAPGLHGFHVHEHGSCEPDQKKGKPTAALAAGSHYDPPKTNQHGAPWGMGHRGDLPALFVNAKGDATHPVLAPRLKLNELKGRALVIHAGGDNYSDTPEPLGGGGERIACAVIK